MTSEAQNPAAEPPPLVALPEMAIAGPAAASVADVPAETTKRPKRSWREERWERRRRRMWFEEILGWILVPLILLSLYYIVMATLAALGTSPSAIMQGLSAITSHL